MKRTFKRFAGLFLSLAVLVSAMNVAAGAEGEAKSKKSALVTYVEKVLPGYLRSNELNSSEYRLSKALISHDWDNGGNGGYLFFIFDRQSIIAQLDVYFYENEFHSTFMAGDFKEVQEVFDDNIPVAFGSYNECFIMRTQKEDVILSVNYKTAPLAGLASAKSDVFKTIAVDNSATFYPAAATRSYMSIMLDVKVVKNLNINGGICWAACVASRVNYHNGNTRLTALDVYNTMSSISHIPVVGNEFYIQSAFEQYGVYTTLSSPLSGESIYNKLSSSKPLLLFLTSTATIGHAVLIYGVSYESTGGGYYHLMDPDLDKLTSVYVSTSVIKDGRNLVYKPSGASSYVEYKWYETIY